VFLFAAMVLLGLCFQVNPSQDCSDVRVSSVPGKIPPSSRKQIFFLRFLGGSGWVCVQKISLITWKKKPPRYASVLLFKEGRGDIHFLFLFHFISSSINRITPSFSFTIGVSGIGILCYGDKLGKRKLSSEKFFRSLFGFSSNKKLICINKGEKTREK